LFENVLTLVEKYPKVAEKLASLIIKENKPSHGGAVCLSQLAGSLFPVVPGSSKFLHQPTPSISAATLIDVQQKTNMTNTGVRQLASSLNKSETKVKFKSNFTKNLLTKAKSSKNSLWHSKKCFLSKALLMSALWSSAMTLKVLFGTFRTLVTAPLMTHSSKSVLMLAELS